MLLLSTLVLFSLQFTLLLLPEGNFVGSTSTPTPTSMGNIGKPGCQTKCGNVTVPYPFGIGTECSLDGTFNLTCNSNSTPPKLFTGSVQVLQITDQSEMRISNSVAFKCYEAGKITTEAPGWTSLGGFPFTFSQKNIFTVIGCDDFAVISNQAQFTSGCLGLCTKTNYASAQCPGVGCCQTSIPKGLKYYNATLFSFENHTGVESFNLCGFAFLGEQQSFQFRGGSDLYNGVQFWERTLTDVPIVVDWVIGGSRNCTQATECKGNSFCEDEDTGGYRCICNEGYQGNPYLGCQAKPADCQTQCGNLTVQYPFGIGKGCSLDESFKLTCNDTYKPPKLFIGSGNINIHSISDSEMTIYNSVSYTCYDKSGLVNGDSSGRIDLKNTPFSFSQKNTFTVIGCDDFAVITGEYGADFTSGCLGLCSKNDIMPNGTCSGVYGCCQTSIPKGLKYYNAKFFSLNNHTSVHSFNPCGIAFLGEEHGYQFGGTNGSSNSTELYQKAFSVPIVVDWVVGGTRDCSQATECKGNSDCKDDADTGGYRCRCKDGYQGNPYLEPGCQDINECQLDKIKLPCYGDCINTPGSYNCTCPQGYTGDAKMADGCTRVGKGSAALVISLALVSGFVVILCGIGISFGIRKRRLIKLREKFFEQNGGVYLKQKLMAPGATIAVTLFTTTQLRKATDNYSEERIVGRGGYGVVYRGILPDKCVVAIKKSKLVDGSQAEQFINEILILTQVIHRNVVKLLGCCLEEEVPVLVYEFISNNTLFYHIHNRSGGVSWLSWENRLRVAAEAAGALAYLHSQTSMPIIHRDVKSANILLDENYTTKISDFGASRLVPIDHDEVTTLVQGTLGYLDPEYFHTSQLTDKSDVYSFGMVLAELITGKKPISADRTNEEKNLATYFVKSMKENHLFQIVEPRLLREGTLEQLQTVAELVKRCLKLQGEDRPTMKEVEMELEGLRKFTTHPWVQLQTPEESRSLTLEVEQSDLYGVPLIPYSSNEWDTYSGITETAFLENKPR